MTSQPFKLDKIVEEYYSKHQVIKGYSTVKLYHGEERLLKKYLKPGDKILDIGCGAGRTSIPLSQKGFEVTAIDLSPNMIEAAKNQARTHNQKIDFRVMDAVQLDFKKESFDLALFSFNGFEQIPGKKNREQVIKNVYDILKPGGIYLFSIKSGLAFGSRRLFVWGWILCLYCFEKIIRRNKSWEFGDKIGFDKNYFHYLNPIRLKSFLKKSGFKILYFNSENNIIKNRRPSFFTNFSSDIRLYYVVEKINPQFK